MKERNPDAVCETCPAYRPFSAEQRQAGGIGGQCRHHWAEGTFGHVRDAASEFCTDHPEWELKP